MNWTLPSPELFILQKLFSLVNTRQFLYDPEHIVKTADCKSFEIYRHRNMILMELRKGPFFLISLSQEAFMTHIPLKHDYVAIEFHGNDGGTQASTEKYHCILNEDQSFRFLISEKNNYPSFINLYNGSGLRKTLFKGFSKLAFACGRKNWIAKGHFTLFYQGTHPLKRFVPSVEEANYSIFSGTKGANRKAVVELHEAGKSSAFLKIPLTATSLKLLDNENQILKLLEKNPLTYTTFPTARAHSNGLKLSNIKPVHFWNKIQLTDLHVECLSELYENYIDNKCLGQLDSYHFIDQQLISLKELPRRYAALDSTIIEAVVIKLRQWHRALLPEKILPVSLSHGDFTPWNMYLTKDKVHLYDWELARHDLPILFDAFHFIFQSATLIGNNPFKKIKEGLLHLVQKESINRLVAKYHIDLELHWKYYLLFTIAYYLPLYVQQRDLHQQAHWLLRNWYEAVNEPNIFEQSTPPVTIT